VSMLESYQFEDCDAVIIDTAKTALDNYLADYVMKQDYKNRRGNVLSLQGYGALGNEFKMWLNRIRQAGKDVYWIAHTKDEKDGDTIFKAPNVTGGTYDLLMQCSDQVGYMTTEQGKRVIKFTVHETYRSKDSAYIGKIQVPDIKHPSYSLFLYELMGRVKSSMADKSKKATSRADLWKSIKSAINAAVDGDTLTEAMNAQLEQLTAEPDKTYLRGIVGQKSKALEVKYNAESKKFEPIQQSVEA